MHPEHLWAIAAQQIADRQAEAQTRLLVKLARQARKARRRGGSAPDPLADIRIPDYVDATFRQETGTLTGSRRTRKAHGGMARTHT